MYALLHKYFGVQVSEQVCRRSVVNEYTWDDTWRHVRVSNLLMSSCYQQRQPTMWLWLSHLRADSQETGSAPCLLFVIEYGTTLRLLTLSTSGFRGANPAMTPNFSYTFFKKNFDGQHNHFTTEFWLFNLIYHLPSLKLSHATQLSSDRLMLYCHVTTQCSFPGWMA